MVITVVPNPKGEALPLRSETGIRDDGNKALPYERYVMSCSSDAACRFEAGAGLGLSWWAEIL